MTLIYQITDTHVALDNKNSTRENFLAVMNYVCQNPADLLVITGDLPDEDGSKEIYQWMKEQFPKGQKTYLIPGNHDDDGNLYEIFGPEFCVSPHFFHTMRLDGIDVIFTNTGSGRFPPEQLDYLSSESVRSQSVLFTHYPTRKISDGFMDTIYPLENLPEVDDVLVRSNIGYVFCGHFHTEYKASGGYEIHVTPSPAFEVDLNEVELKLSSAGIPIRKIEIEGASTLSEVIYLDE
ncbi:MAG: hypothetical protein CMQ20_03790 [Gammaproteobacteria bacterium]|jgi:3',5'-cyclic AMP phosphodiesterase CpdA|nr:hypothetical protein [Gammaproteobacteria bacterium]|tara:strand:- start:673 stop:1380 length:708 start_codon:yes stop_codon:yes gene_type:complete